MLNFFYIGALHGHVDELTLERHPNVAEGGKGQTNPCIYYKYMTNLHTELFIAFQFTVKYAMQCAPCTLI